VQHWYVYYKLPRGAEATAVDALRAMQRRLAEATGVRARLMQRIEDIETTTLMEIYEDIAEPARFASALEAAVRSATLPREVVEGRRTERFQDL
jgi:hypothetical protein